MEEYSVVRVVRLEKSKRTYDGTEGVKRPPQIGDTGTIVHINSPDENYIVENVSAEGYTIWLAEFVSSELEIISEAKSMPDRIASITSELTRVAADATATFGTLTAAQINWKPAEKSWSVGQCLDHIIKTNHEFDAEFEKLASGTRRNSFWENYSPLTGWAGRFLIKAVTEDSKKVKAPSARIVPPSDIDSDIVERFASDIERVNKQVEACAAADREKTIVTSPFLFVFTYKLDDAFTVLVEHTKRHVRQAKRVMAAEIFPR